MRRSVTRVSAAVAAGAALSALGITGVSAAGAATGARQQVRAVALAADTQAVAGARLWVKRYNGPGNGGDGAMSVAVGPGGGTVFVTGTSMGSTTGYDYATVAYSVATGARLWVARYNGPANGEDDAQSVAVSPDGSTVFVAGTSRGPTANGDYATVAYNAATGAQRWVKRYNGPGNGSDQVASLAVSPDGGTVFVTGSSQGIGPGGDYATIAYGAATGAQRWVSRYNGPGNRTDGAESVAVSPNGAAVYVTGYSSGTTSGDDYATAAYSAATGAQRWVRRYNGPANGEDSAESVAVSPSGATVYVTGTSPGNTSHGDYATAAYTAATGAQRWVKRYNGPGNGQDYASAVTVSPAGRVFVTGTSPGTTSNADYATVAYRATGARLWVRRYNGPGNGTDTATSMVSPGNGKVYITGISWGGPATRNDYATVGYDVFTGTRLWAQRYNGPASSGDYAFSVTARGGRVFVTGGSEGATSGLDYASVAYNG